MALFGFSSASNTGITTSSMQVQSESVNDVKDTKEIVIMNNKVSDNQEINFEHETLEVIRAQKEKKILYSTFGEEYEEYRKKTRF